MALTERVELRLHAEEAAALTEAAVKENRTKSEVIRRALSFYLSHQHQSESKVFLL